MATPPFVGGFGGGVNAAGGNVPLNSLSGGLASAAAVGDVVVLAVSVNSSSDLTIAVSTAGYTKVAELYANSTWDTNLAVFVKKLTTAETSVVATWGNTSPATVAVSVYRGVADVILDATSTTWTVVNTGIPNAPAIATVTDDAVVLAVGGASGSRLGSPQLNPLTVPSGMTDFVSGFYTTTVGTSGTSVAAIAAAARSSAGSYDPPTFGGGRLSADNSAAAISLALRPFASATNVSGALPSFTVTAPAGSVAGKAAVSGALPAMTVAAPTATATGRAAVSAALPGITVAAPSAVVGLATLVSVPLPGFVVSGPAATVVAGAAVSADLPGFTVSLPTAEVAVITRVFAPLSGFSVSAPAGQITIPIKTPPERRFRVSSTRQENRRFVVAPTDISRRRFNTRG